MILDLYLRFDFGCRISVGMMGIDRPGSIKNAIER